MPALSFSVFREKILDGSKRQTIRAIRKRAIATGDKLFLYWKQQSPKDCEKLGEATCTSVRHIQIMRNGYVMPYESQMVKARLDTFAIADGFESWDDLVSYFEKSYGLPFKGVLIQWNGIIKDSDPELVEALNDWSAPMAMEVYKSKSKSVKK